MRGTYAGVYSTPGDRPVYCVCPTHVLPEGGYKRLGDTEEGVWMVKSLTTGKRHLLLGIDGRRLVWGERPTKGTPSSHGGRVE